MSQLKRAPKQCGSWFWDLEDVAPPGLESALAVAAKMTAALQKFDLLSPVKLEYGWYVLDSGATGVMSTLFVFTPLDDPGLPGKVLGSRPSAFPDAEVDDLHVVGSGTWLDAEGKAHREPRLVELAVSPDPLGPTATLAVHHDIWNQFDFSGRPHPEVHDHNAPRLAAALRELNSTLGVTPELGEPTYFGSATEFGIAAPDPHDDGTGPDLTDKL
ncbi:hypothetical protein C3486_02345 [Streptomyces sp. Ru73]|uniref:hypothetical protein n=1 Tax=Streptomyces sp. Ru73 TaxID=2080748 RepID=UPI000CDD987B|nr:hypothetical protein [Streptomyces sp. Ru73]POX43077.1 hypothetical protein C3486_02345 [Streptomyces sp. Ru73]